MNMSKKELQRYASWLVNEMENEMDDVKYAEYEKILTAVINDMEGLE